MVSRMHFDDEAQAVEAAEKIDAAGYEVAIVQERFAGEDDDEAVEYVVASPATPEMLVQVVGDDVFITSDDEVAGA